MIISKKVISCDVNSHRCDVCGEDLQTKLPWFVNIILCVLLLLPAAIFIFRNEKKANKLDPPYCYQEEKIGEKIKRIFVEC